MLKIIRFICLFIGLLYPIQSNALKEKTDSIIKKKNQTFSTYKIDVENVKDDITAIVQQVGKTVRENTKKLNDIDTAYISPNIFNLTFMLEQSTWYEHYRLGNNSNNNRQSINFSPTLGTKLGIYFGWRWIFLGYTFDIEDLFGNNKNKPKKKEMSLNIYSSKFGIDLYYRETGSDFKIRSYDGFGENDLFKNIHFDGLKSRIKGLNAYWIFNHKKFSYPSVYSQSTNQLRSAGSIMAGLSYSQHLISFDPTKLPVQLISKLESTLWFNKIKYTDYSLGFGYGYNWVFAKNWVSNISLLPGIGYKKSKVDDNNFKNEHWIKDINFNLITRAGIVYNNSKYFAGVSFVMHTYDYRKPNLSVTNSFGTLRIYAGFNFWKKKQYR